MKNLIKMELYKALHNRFFIVACIIGILLSLLHLLYMVQAYGLYQAEIYKVQMFNNNQSNPMVHGFTLYNRWIGGESYTLFYSVFFMVFPLFATCSYGWSYCIEKKNGYLRNVFCRVGRGNYIFAKFIGIFCAGGISVTVPLMVNFLTEALIIPAIIPDISYPYYTVSQGNILSELFYTKPFLFVLIYIGIIYIFCGLIAGLSLAVSLYVKNRFAVVIVPFFCILGIHYGRTFLYYVCYIEISPLNFLHPMPVQNAAVWSIILLEAAVFIGIIFIARALKRKKNEII